MSAFRYEADISQVSLNLRNGMWPRTPKIHRGTRNYSVLRGENFVCSCTPSSSHSKSISFVSTCAAWIVADVSKPSDILPNVRGEQKFKRDRPTPRSWPRLNPHHLRRRHNLIRRKIMHH